MQLVRKEIVGRAFLLQFQSVMQEFGRIIPWLYPAYDLHYITNSRYFEEKLYGAIGCPFGSIIPYQLVSSDRSHEYIGSILHFTAAPEHFHDPALERLRLDLVSRGAAYISCLQIREIKRGSGYGATILRRSIKRILAEWPEVWAVCEPALVSWYASFGATVHDPGHNWDNLAVLTWK